MSALLLLLGLLAGSAVAPASIAAITPIMWATIGINAAAAGPQVIKFVEAIKAEMKITGVKFGQPELPPDFAQWVAANGDTAIRLQPGIITTR